jgi:hypothetical protein
MSSQSILLGPPFSLQILILKFNARFGILAERDAWVLDDGKDIESDLTNLEMGGYPVTDKIEDTVGEDVVGAGAVVDGSGLETVEFEECAVDDGKGNEMVDFIVFRCRTRFVTLEGV